MSTIAVCSICSRSKREGDALLPAVERYSGSHVLKVAEIAKESGAPFFILSGVYGFISATERIPNYDHLLVSGEVAKLSELITAQLRRHTIAHVRFYTKKKPNWQPYLKALAKAAAAAGIPLTVHLLQEND